MEPELSTLIERQAEVVEQSQKVMWGSLNVIIQSQDGNEYVVDYLRAISNLNASAVDKLATLLALEASAASDLRLKPR